MFIQQFNNGRGNAHPSSFDSNFLNTEADKRMLSKETSSPSTLPKSSSSPLNKKPKKKGKKNNNRKNKKKKPMKKKKQNASKNEIKILGSNSVLDVTSPSYLDGINTQSTAVNQVC